MNTVYSLYKELMDYHTSIDPETFPKRKSYRGYLKGKLLDHKLYEYRIDGELLGIGIYYFNKRIMCITDLVIGSSYRGKGHGKRLLEALEGIGRKRGCVSISLRVSGFNEAGIKLYRSSGFRDASITMYKRYK
jgi:ribosomal protein S18 acetylase RimI-like enzyme